MGGLTGLRTHKRFTKLQYKINNFEEFLGVFLEYLRIMGDLFPVTRSGFIQSPNCKISSTGLIIELSDNITRLNAICVKCGDLANFSYRKTNDKSRVLIGESEKYEPRCEKCYYNKKGYK